MELTVAAGCSLGRLGLAPFGIAYISALLPRTSNATNP